MAVVILAVSLILGLSFWGLDDEKTPSEAPSEPMAKTMIAEKHRYIMREFEGQIAVFNEDGTVYNFYEVNVSLLPEYDQKLLKSGIEIVGEDELRARIEDYTS